MSTHVQAKWLASGTDDDDEMEDVENVQDDDDALMS